MPASEMMTVPFSEMLLRQTPGHSGVWEEFIFDIEGKREEYDFWVVIDNVFQTERFRLPPGRTVLMAFEQDAVRQYDAEFCGQFAEAITCQVKLPHPRLTFCQMPVPWFINRSFDEFMAEPPPQKTKLISVVSSNKTMSLGHQRRLAFARQVAAALHPHCDLFGRNIRGFQDKSEVLRPYRFSIALENRKTSEYMTEKLSECFLEYTFPFYWGCPEAAEYYPADAFLPIDIDRPQKALNDIVRCLENPHFYEERLPALIEARKRYLLRHQLFPMLAEFLREMVGREEYSPARETVEIRKDEKPGVVLSPAYLPPQLAVPSVSLCTDYEGLNSESVVVDIGAGDGQWASDLFSRFLPRMFLFEPMPELAKASEIRFRGNPQVKVALALIGVRDGKADLPVDESSRGEGGVIQARTFEAAALFRKMKIEQIDLLKVTLGGDEYDLVEHLLDAGWMPRIGNLQVRFNETVPHALERVRRIHQRLAETHAPTFLYPMLRENWRKRLAA